MFNDFRGFTESGEPIHIAVPPTLLISTLGVMRDVSRATTLDLKAAGDFVYLLGETHDELGASEYFSWLSDRFKKPLIGNNVPRVDTARNFRTYQALARAIAKGYVASALPLSRGGLAVALAKSAAAGDLGLKVNLKKIAGSAREGDSVLFSESHGRVLVSVRPSARREFESISQGVALTKIGVVTAKGYLDLEVPGEKVSIPLTTLSRAYRAPFLHW